MNNNQKNKEISVEQLAGIAGLISLIYSVIENGLSWQSIVKFVIAMAIAVGVIYIAKKHLRMMGFFEKIYKKNKIIKLVFFCIVFIAFIIGGIYFFSKLETPANENQEDSTEIDMSDENSSNNDLSSAEMISQMLSENCNERYYYCNHGDKSVGEKNIHIPIDYGTRYEFQEGKSFPFKFHNKSYLNISIIKYNEDEKIVSFNFEKMGGASLNDKPISSGMRADIKIPSILHFYVEGNKCGVLFTHYSDLLKRGVFYLGSQNCVKLTVE